MSLREADLIRTLQLTPATNELCQSTRHGFAPDTRSRTASINKALRRGQRTTILVKAISRAPTCMTADSALGSYSIDETLCGLVLLVFGPLSIVGDA
jgi:hypothetical protein